MAEPEFGRVVAAFESASVAFEVVEHEAVRTSEEAASVRGGALSRGVKAMVLKVRRAGQSSFVVVDFPANRKLDWKRVRKALGAQEVRFATEEEVVAETGCDPGGVPPLGHATGLPIVVDPRVFDEPTVEFNAGMRTRSVRLASAGLRRALDAAGASYVEVCG